jgi:PPOX class probable F420-dependent enzyme
MPERTKLTMTDDEVAAFLDGGRRVHVATIDADGTPHLVPLAYVMVDGRLTLWTDPGSKKVANVRRDPRLTCLVEEGSEFADFRAVQLVGRAEVVDDPDASLRTGVALFERYAPPGTDPEQLRRAASALVTERVAVVVTPERVLSWDHRKLAGLRPADVGR